MFSLTMRKVKCPDGSVKTIYRKPRKAFPLALTELSGKAEAAIGGLQAVSGKVTGEYAKEYRALLMHLDETNGSMQAELAAVYTAFSSDPCHDPGYFHRKVDEILDNRDSFQHLVLRAKLIAKMIDEGADSTEVGPLIRETMRELVSPATLQVKRAVEQAPEIVGAWDDKSGDRR
jgi:hypothetical protein